MDLSRLAGAVALVGIATIGAAQRYQESQVSAADVKVEDQQFQAFLQSDLFRQLANDKAARNALNNPDLQKALADANVRAILARTDVRTEIANNAKQLARLEVVASVIATLKLDAATEAALEAALNVSPALLHAITDANIADAFLNSSLAQVLANVDAAVAVSTNAVLEAINQASLNVSNEASTNVSTNAVSK